MVIQNHFDGCCMQAVLLTDLSCLPAEFDHVQTRDDID